MALLLSSVLSVRIIKKLLTLFPCLSDLTLAPYWRVASAKLRYIRLNSLIRHAIHQYIVPRTRDVALESADDHYWLFAFALAFGHHFFYNSLVSQPVSDDGYDQLFNKGIGTAFAYLMRAALVICIGSTHWQIF